VPGAYRGAGGRGRERREGRAGWGCWAHALVHCDDGPPAHPPVHVALPGHRQPLRGPRARRGPRRPGPPRAGVSDLRPRGGACRAAPGKAPPPPLPQPRRGQGRLRGSPGGRRPFPPGPPRGEHPGHAAVSRAPGVGGHQQGGYAGGAQLTSRSGASSDGEPADEGGLAPQRLQQSPAACRG